MSEDAVKAKAIAFEALLKFYSGDRDKAWRVLSSLSADFSLPFASYTREFTSSPEEEREFNEIWRSVRDGFMAERVPFRVEEYSYPGDEHFIYVAGKERIGDEKRLVILGSPLPSLKAKDDIFNCVSFASSQGWAVIAPFDSGSGSYALSCALKLGAKAIAVLSSSVTKCPSESMLDLMGKTFENGTLISVSSPVVKFEKWHVVRRNRFISSFGDGFFLSEEKDGGPSWPIFDSAVEKGKKVMIPLSLGENPNYRWCRDRLEKGAYLYSKPKDLLKLFPHHRERTRERRDDLTPSLFGDDCI